MAKTTKPDEVKKPGLWSRMKTWQKVLVIFLGIGFLGALSGDETVNDSFEAGQRVAEQVIESSDDSNEETIIEEDTPKTEIVEVWQKVITLSGSADKKSEPFSIMGKRWKAIYTLDGDTDYTLFNAYAIEPGDSFGDSIVTFASESGETVMYTSGEFHLDVTSANCSWTLEIQELVEVEKPL